MSFTAESVPVTFRLGCMGLQARFFLPAPGSSLALESVLSLCAYPHEVNVLESSIVLRRAPLPRAELDALLARYREAADHHGPESKRALKIRNEVIEANMRLVAMIAQRYRLPRGWELDDLLAFGVPGLITAIERFDLSRGFCFSTYAAWWVRHSINRALADTATAIRVPVHAQDSLAREARGDDLKPATKWTEEARAARRAVLSLDAPISTDGEARPWIELHHDRDALAPDDAYIAAEDDARVRAALDALPEHDRALVSARIYDERTLLEIGKSMDRSRERIRQRQNEIFGVMAAHLGEA